MTSSCLLLLLPWLLLLLLRLLLPMLLLLLLPLLLLLLPLLLLLLLQLLVMLLLLLPPPRVMASCGGGCEHEWPARDRMRLVVTASSLCLAAAGTVSLGCLRTARHRFSALIFSALESKLHAACRLMMRSCSTRRPSCRVGSTPPISPPCAPRRSRPPTMRT